MLKSHQRGDLTQAETKVDYLPFAKVLYEERNEFKWFSAGNGGTYHGVKRTKVCSLHFRREDSRNYLNGRITERFMVQVCFVRSLAKER